PPEVWHMDSAECIRLANGEQVCWLRVVDEFTGAALQTTIFPPSPVGSGGYAAGSGGLAPGVHALGPARPDSGGQRRAGGGGGRLPGGPGRGADRGGHRDDLEPAAAAAGQRGGGAFAGGGEELGGAVDVRGRERVAATGRGDGPAATGGVRRAG